MLSPLHALRTPGAKPAVGTPPTATLKERAYAQIRHQIETRGLQRGTRVSNRKLAQALGMSAIPVREAITQLVGEGLLEHRPGIGTFVMNPSRGEIEDVYELRMVLEAYAARRAALVIGDRGMSEMRQSIEWMRQISQRVGQEPAPPHDSHLYEQWCIADAAFHLAVLRRAGNQFAVKMVTGLRLMTRVFGHEISQLRMRSLEVPLREHADILHAVEQGDPKGASRLMRAHIRGGRAIALRHDDQLRREETGVTGHEHGPLAGWVRQIALLEDRSG